MLSPADLKIIDALAIKSPQGFNELVKNSGLGRETVWLLLKDLTKNEIGQDEDKQYFLQCKITNRKVLDVKNSGIMNFDHNLIEQLRKEGNPFELGCIIIRSAMQSLSHLTLEKNSPQLTTLDKIECEKQIKYYNEGIRKTFEVLTDIDPDQTLVLREALNMGLNVPFVVGNNRKDRRKYLKKLEKLVHPTQRGRADRIIKKIAKHVPEITQRLKDNTK